MMEKRELICIGCPMGCPLTVEMNGTEVSQCHRKYLSER